MLEDRNYLTKLFDIYGELLSSKERLVMEHFLNADLAEIEIAENLGETRQAVYDALKKAKTKLQNFEKCCEVARQNEEIKKILISLKNVPASEQNKIIDEIIKKL